MIMKGGKSLEVAALQLVTDMNNSVFPLHVEDKNMYYLTDFHHKREKFLLK